MAFHMTAADVPGFEAGDERDEQLVRMALARSRAVAPCLARPDFPSDGVHFENAVAIIASMVMRWAETGTGALSQVQEGSYGQTFNSSSGRIGHIFPTEIRALQDMCRDFTGMSGSGGGTVFTGPMRATGGYL